LTPKTTVGYTLPSKLLTRKFWRSYPE